jgi:hypothetical protein
VVYTKSPQRGGLLLLSSLSRRLNGLSLSRRLIGLARFHGAYKKEHSMSRDWLSKLQPFTRINQIAIPSTHDSSAYTKYSWIPGIKGTWAQRQSITEQLNLGVRALDLRVGLQSDDIYDEPFIGMFHGPIYLSIDLEDVLAEIKRWLNANQGEFVIMIFQQQGFLGKYHRDISDEVKDMVNDTFDANERFEPNPLLGDWPKISELEGRVMSFGRLKDNVNGFFNVREWLSTGDNSPGTEINVSGTGLKLYLQDRYKGLTSIHPSGNWIETKKDFNKAKLAVFKQAAEKEYKPKHLLINHLSHSSLRYQPWQLGKDLNLELQKETYAKYHGLIMLDDVDAATADFIIAMNGHRLPGTKFD